MHESSFVCFHALLWGNYVIDNGENAILNLNAEAITPTRQSPVVDTNSCDAGGDIDENVVNFLRGENAWAGRKVDEAEFFFRGLAERAEDDEVKDWASRRLASAYLQNRQVARAEEALRSAPGDQGAGLDALAVYAEGTDKNPKLGGWLGLIPGLGYAYAGEYANALRSLILNSIFIFGMVDTAGDEEWGAFAAITFFEITWYSGSIYGGIDASHRYNRNRLEDAINAVQGDSSWRAELGTLPLISLRFSF
jgi:hypothetical protein